MLKNCMTRPGLGALEQCRGVFTTAKTNATWPRPTQLTGRAGVPAGFGYTLVNMASSGSFSVASFSCGRISASMKLKGSAPAHKMCSFMYLDAMSDCHICLMSQCVRHMASNDKLGAAHWA